MKSVFLMGIMILMALAGSARVEQAKTTAKPNVIFIVIDDLRRDLGTYGSPVVKSPNIDKLASEGVRFDNAYCQYPVCNPSRTSFLTGLRPDSTRILDNSTKFRTTIPDVVTLPQLFRENGYFTVSLGKIFHRGLTMEDLRPEMDDQKSWDVSRYFQATETGLRGEGRNMTGGKLAWCHWLAAEGVDEDQPDGMIARDAISILEEQARNDRPFFLALGFHKPHDPFIAPKKYFDLYPLEKLKLARVTSPLQSDPAPALPGGAFREAFDRFTDRERREFMRSYYAGTSFTDAQIGKVIAALERLKQRENTIIVVMGDHGYHLGERGWWNKNTLFELSARAPVIVSAPQAKIRGKASNRLIEFIDFYPTLVELCSLPAPAHLQGKSIAPLLDDPKRPWKEAAYTQVRRGRIDGYSVRTERWRYTEWDGGRAGSELYDHRNDPHELRNLAGDQKMAETVAEMKRLLVRIR
ncbi:MAG: sulfatase [Acidobacteriota bacterium]|nr:MAG: sulfatase [Acidobacteriota bacterium]